MTEPEKPEGQREVASYGQVKRIVRSILRRQAPHEENFLNIYPMMDMMTILLVFLVMQFAAQTLEVLESDDMRLPISISPIQPEEAVTVQITRREIAVGGKHAVDLRNGLVDPSDKQGGGTGLLIVRLKELMAKERDVQKLIGSRVSSRSFRGIVRIVADRRTPFRTLAEVAYTVGQAEYSNLRFLTVDSSGG